MSHSIKLEMAQASGRGNDMSIFRTSYPEGVLYKKPLVLLVDALSASASEVLAGVSFFKLFSSIINST